MLACLYLAIDAVGKHLRTVEGLAQRGPVVAATLVRRPRCCVVVVSPQPHAVLASVRVRPAPRELITPRRAARLPRSRGQFWHASRERRRRDEHRFVGVAVRPVEGVERLVMPFLRLVPGDLHR